MGLYGNEVEKKGVQQQITDKYYHTNQDGIIDKGPYMGLTVKEAGELNKAQQEDYRKQLIEEKQKAFRKSITGAMNEAGETIFYLAKNAGNFTPLWPIITGSFIAEDLMEGNYGYAMTDAALSVMSRGLEVAPVARAVGENLKAIPINAVKSAVHTIHGSWGPTLAGMDNILELGLEETKPVRDAAVTIGEVLYEGAKRSRGMNKYAYPLR